MIGLKKKPTGNIVDIGASLLIDVAGVSKTYGTGWKALASTSLKIHRGEVLGLVGPSGCGKSTFLRILAGLVPPSSGTISWSNSADDPVHCVGFVFQEPTLMPWSTVLANTRLPLDLMKVERSEANRRALNALAQVGLAEFSDSYPRQLSGGMKMRASIARALVTNPSTLLLDEPFGALDEITRFKLNDDLLQLQRERNLTILFVTHSIFEAAYLSNRVLVMAARPGRVVSDIFLDQPKVRTSDYRISSAYLASCQMLSDALADASESGV